jgi:hypothetical protein
LISCRDIDQNTIEFDAISIPHDGSSSGLELTQLEIKQDEDKGNDPF